MGLAESSSATALKLITKYGKSVVVTRVTVPGVYDTATGKTSAPTTAQQTIKAYVTDFQARGFNAPNILVKTGDKMILVAGSGFTKPDLGDTFTVGGITYSIVPIKDNGMEIVTVSVKEVDVLYKIHGRHS